ncbi:hypothetical protein ElyMa_005265700 [Elysia marginata]|uniref:Uncharacterized protein n=1 Tax=Elysia marginata TaxID=1093978 RepID=A0AAV4K2J5_9GAST|nr:hypothetical protein ElyMa_005265700 [Elysia marginata]
MEGLNDSYPLKWYIQQRNPVVQFQGVGDITPETSTDQSVTVLYSVGNDDDLNNLKKVELKLQDLLSEESGSDTPPRQMVYTSQYSNFHTRQQLAANENPSAKQYCPPSSSTVSSHDANMDQSLLLAVSKNSPSSPVRGTDDSPR